MQQKALYIFRLSAKDLFNQVIENVTVAAGKGGNKVRNVGTALHRKRCQLQSGDPSLGASF